MWLVINDPDNLSLVDKQKKQIVNLQNEIEALNPWIKALREELTSINDQILDVGGDDYKKLKVELDLNTKLAEEAQHIFTWTNT